MVMAMVEWPSVSMTTRGWTPCASRSAAAVWRRSWKRRRGKPRASEHALQLLGHVTRLQGCPDRRAEDEV